MSPRKPPEDARGRPNYSNPGNHHADLSLGSRMKMARMAAKLSGEDVAQELKISRQSVSHWEADRSQPRDERLPELAKLYKVRLEWLTLGQGPMKEQSTADDEPSSTAEDIARQVKAKERQQLLLETLLTVQKTTFGVARISISHDEIAIDILMPDKHIHKSI